MITPMHIYSAIMKLTCPGKDFVAVTLTQLKRVLARELRSHVELRVNTRELREALRIYALANSYRLIIITGSRHRRKIYFFRDTNHPLAQILMQKGSFLSIYVVRDGKLIHVHSNSSGKRGLNRDINI